MDALGEAHASNQRGSGGLHHRADWRSRRSRRARATRIVSRRHRGRVGDAAFNQAIGDVARPRPRAAHRADGSAVPARCRRSAPRAPPHASASTARCRPWPYTFTLKTGCDDDRQSSRPTSTPPRPNARSIHGRCAPHDHRRFKCFGALRSHDHEQANQSSHGRCPRGRGPRLIDPAEARAQSSATVGSSARQPCATRPTARAAVGATVVATSPALQGEQVAITDENGQYFITSLPPGIYTLTVYYNDATFSRGNVLIQVGKEVVVNVTVDTGAATGKPKGEVIEIAGTAPIVDQGSTKTGIDDHRRLHAQHPDRAYVRRRRRRGGRRAGRQLRHLVRRRDVGREHVRRRRHQHDRHRRSAALVVEPAERVHRRRPRSSPAATTPSSAARPAASSTSSPSRARTSSTARCSATSSRAR